MATWLLILGASIPGVVSAAELSIVGPPALESLLESEEGGWVSQAQEHLGRFDPGTLVMVSYLFQVPDGPAEGPHVLTVTIPIALDYQPGTAAGPGSQALVSFDGGLNFEADRVGPRQDPSQARSLDAGATHLRWVFSNSLQPGVRGYVRYRAVKLAPPGRARPDAAPPQDGAAAVVDDDGREN